MCSRSNLFRTPKNTHLKTLDEPHTTARDEAEEVRCAAAWAAQRGARVVGLVGHSKGATTALLYASKYHDIPR